MMRGLVLAFLILIAGCTPTPPQLPEDFDPTFTFFIAPD